MRTRKTRTFQKQFSTRENTHTIQRRNDTQQQKKTNTIQRRNAKNNTHNSEKERHSKSSLEASLKNHPTGRIRAHPARRLPAQGAFTVCRSSACPRRTSTDTPARYWWQSSSRRCACLRHSDVCIGFFQWLAFQQASSSVVLFCFALQDFQWCLSDFFQWLSFFFFAVFTLRPLFWRSGTFSEKMGLPPIFAFRHTFWQRTRKTTHDSEREREKTHTHTQFREGRHSTAAKTHTHTIQRTRKNTMKHTQQSFKHNAKMMQTSRKDHSNNHTNITQRSRKDHGKQNPSTVRFTCFRPLPSLRPRPPHAACHPPSPPPPH